MYACKDRGAHRAAIVVLQRNQRRSAFDGYRAMYSDYSELFCGVCESLWRTKAAYVADYPWGTMATARAAAAATVNDASPDDDTE